MPRAKATDHDPGPMVSAERGEAQAEAARHPIKVEDATGPMSEPTAMC